MNRIRDSSRAPVRSTSTSNEASMDRQAAIHDLTPLRDLSRRRRVTRAEDASVWHRDTDQDGVRTSVVQWVADDGHLVPALERGALPTGADHHVRTAALE